MNPGTLRNNERTGNRDPEFSELMRKPRFIRSCDFDVQPFCPVCKRPIVMWEVKREFPDYLWAVNNSEYTRNAAEDFGVPAYFLFHEACERIEEITVVRFPDLKTVVMTREQFIKWVEDKQLEHEKKFHCT